MAVVEGTCNSKGTTKRYSQKEQPKRTAKRSSDIAENKGWLFKTKRHPWLILLSIGSLRWIFTWGLAGMRSVLIKERMKQADMAQ